MFSSFFLFIYLNMGKRWKAKRNEKKTNILAVKKTKIDKNHFSWDMHPPGTIAMIVVTGRNRFDGSTKIKYYVKNCVLRS